MLTIEMLQQNPVLKDLAQSQLAAIAEMSQNDENTVIGTKIGELHGQYDADILSITGVAKNSGEKSYEYAKRVLNDYKAKVASTATIQTQLDAAKAKVTDLEAKLAAGAGDESLKQQLKDSKNQVTQLQSQLAAKEVEMVKAKEKFDTDLKSTHVDYAFKAATAGIKFKEGISEGVQKILIDSAKAEVLAKGTPDFIDDGNGGKRLVFRNKEGVILNNPNNNLNPYTAEELIKQTSIKDVIAEARVITGGGTKPNVESGRQTTTTLDLSSIKTQLEADKAIENYLLSNGLTRDSEEFATQSMQLRADNNVSQLPIR